MRATCVTAGDMNGDSPCSRDKFSQRLACLEFQKLYPPGSHAFAVLCPPFAHNGIPRTSSGASGLLFRLCCVVCVCVCVCVLSVCVALHVLSVRACVRVGGYTSSLRMPHAYNISTRHVTRSCSRERPIHYYQICMNETSRSTREISSACISECKCKGLCGIWYASPKWQRRRPGLPGLAHCSSSSLLGSLVLPPAVVCRNKNT